MGDSTCLMQMQQPFSYVSGLAINDPKESNPMHALSQSVSFGRFMSEPLAWEKWSTFSSHKRYVEEAQSYAQPGSVAQKKAFFEAHYRELAARKAAAAAVALEQAQAASDNAPEPECSDLQTKISDSQAPFLQQEAKVVPSSEAGLVLEAYRPNSDKVLDSADDIEVAAIEPIRTSSNQAAAPGNGQCLSNIKEIGQMELSGTPSMEKPLLKDSKLTQQSSVPRNKKLLFPTLRTSIHSRPSKAAPSPAKPIASVWPKRDTNVTPVSKKSSMDYTEKRKSTPKSTHKSMSFTPAREFNKLTSSVIRKIENSRYGASSSKAYKDKNCCTPLRTPIMGSMNKADKHPLATPQSENRRARTYNDPASDSKPNGSRWCFLSTDCSKFLSASRNKAQSPSSVFSLRTEERAARRKEKLEEKFNAKFTEKIQLQTKIKEKAETEIKRLRQTLCFKARPLPDFYKDRSTANNEASKVPLHPQSPKLGKKLTPGTLLGLTALPQKPTVKNSGSKKVLAKNGQCPTSILTARFRMPAHENASPNIQYG